MIFNFFISIVVTIIWRTMQVNTSFSTNFLPSKHLELKKAVELNTGFEYPPLDELQQLKFNAIKKKLNISDTVIGNNVMLETIEIMYCDLACGNMHLLYNYLIIYKDVNKYHLSEEVTSQMLASLFKINKRLYDSPFWHVHMLLLHSSICHREPVIIDSSIIYNIIDYLKHKIDHYCRNENSHNMIWNPHNYIDWIMEIQKHNNSILLENDIEKNWVSLKSIYLHKFISEIGTMRQIIITFGNQTFEVFKEIHNDLYKSYDEALNYYYINHWMIQIGKYQEQMLNVIRTVALHLIRKHMIYALKYWKLKNTVFGNVDVGINDMNKYILNNDFFKTLFSFNFNEVIVVLKNSAKKPKIENGVNLTIREAIKNIEDIMKFRSPKFVLLDYKSQLDGAHADDIIKILKNNINQIKSYLNYLEKLFEEYNINTSVSYITMSEHIIWKNIVIDPKIKELQKIVIN